MSSKSTNRRILVAAATVAIAGAVVTAAGAARDLVIANQFGAGDSVDAFFLALTVPTAAILVFGSALGGTTVPQFLALRERGDRHGADRLLGAVAAVSLSVFVVLAVGLALVREPIMHVLTAGFPPEKARLTGQFYLLLLPCIVIQGWSALIGQLINAGERFAAVALAPILRPVAVIALLAVPAGAAHSLALAIGYLAGSVLEAAVIWTVAVRAGISTCPRWYGLDAPLRAVLREFGAVATAALIAALAPAVNQYLAALLASGSVAALNYGSKVIGVVVSLGAAPLAIAVLPHFAVYAGRQDWKGLSLTLVQWSGPIFLAGTIVAIGGAVYAEPIVRLLFERGQFSSAQTEIVAHVQAYGMLQIPFYLSGILFARALLVLQHGRLLAVLSGLGLATNVGGSLVLMRYLGPAGIAAAISLGYASTWLISGCFVFLLLRRRGA